jgi:hypothetical protein
VSGRPEHGPSPEETEPKRRALEWLAASRRAPRRTVFIKGNLEDFEWLDAQKDADPQS